MNEIISNKLMTKKDGGEYLLELSVGDTFVSFHLNDGNCLGFFLKKEELSQTNLESIFYKIIEYFSLDEIRQVEVKIIGMMSSLKKVESFLVLKNINNIKIIPLDKVSEIMFLPLLNKVRVSKDPKIFANDPIPLEKSITKYKILIVDDSKTIRNILAKIFSSDPAFIVCAMAEKPSQVEALILKHRPDVITLDIHMPEIDGVTLLKTIAPKYNIPTIMISSISIAEGPLVLEALENGALDYIQKPDFSEIERVTPHILEKVRMAAKANLTKKVTKPDSIIAHTKYQCDLNSLIVIGSSTGGTEAIKEIIMKLPEQIPPILIVQHIPAIFSAAFASRMNDLRSFEVKEALNGDEVRSNRILVAPGGMQMKLIYENGKAFVEINNDEPVNRFKPSVDYLFSSVAQNIYTTTVAIILTGMGKDGAEGMLELKKLGARTIAQDENTSAVFGMPKEAIAIGAVEFIEPITAIAERATLLTSSKSNQVNNKTLVK